MPGSEYTLPTFEPVFLTDEIAPAEFELKREPDDFCVDEEPLYRPCGEGDHLYLRIEKRDRTTPQAIGMLAQALGRKRRDFGYAGMKDRHGVTTQWISIEHVEPRVAHDLDLDGVRVLEVGLHRNKLRLGHLRGNRFRIALRGLDASGAQRARRCLSEIERIGLPNWFGEQRFGRMQNGHELGARILFGDWCGYLLALVQADCPQLDAASLRVAIAEGDFEMLLQVARLVGRPLSTALEKLAAGKSPRSAARVISRRIRELHLSALQSHLFNCLLAKRLEDEAFDDWRPLEGEVLWIHASGASFLASSVDAELVRRVRRFEVSPAGPLPGARLLEAEREVARREDSQLLAAGIARDDFARAGLRGARRPFRVPLRDAMLELQGGVAWLEFSLPKGSYATALVAELRKRFSGRESGPESARSGDGGAESPSS